MRHCFLFFENTLCGNTFFIEVTSGRVKQMILGPAFKIQWAPTGDQNRSIGAQMLQKTYVPLLWGASLQPPGAAEAARYAQGLTLNDFR